jgi:hypothetical protein
MLFGKSRQEVEECFSPQSLNDEIIDWSLNQLEQDDPKLVQILQENYLVKASVKPINLTNPASSITLSGQYKQPILLDSDYFG